MFHDWSLTTTVRLKRLVKSAWPLSEPGTEVGEKVPHTAERAAPLEGEVELDATPTTQDAQAAEAHQRERRGLGDNADALGRGADADLVTIHCRA